MLQERDLQELAELSSEKSPILSLYLNVDPHRRSADEYKLSLRQLLSQAASQGAAAADVERVERFFEHEYTRQGRSVACFSQQSGGFWRVYVLLVPLQDYVVAGPRAYVKPLGDVMDDYGRFGVITVDREGARAFIYHLGALEDSAGTMGTEVKRHKQGGWAAQRLQRHEDEEAKHNLKEAAEWAGTYLREHNVTRVVLSGSDGNLAMFRELLPRALQDQVVGQVSVDMSSSPAEVWERSFEVAQQAQRKAEEDLLAQVVTLAHKGGAAAIGLPDTLAALQQGRARHLLAARNYHMPGRQCAECEAVVVEDLKKCPYCGHELGPVADAVDIAVRSAMKCGVKVSIMDPSPLMEEAGGIAAALRY